MASFIFMRVRSGFFLFLFLIFYGCGASTPIRPAAAIEDDGPSAKPHCTLFCLRQPGYAGQGRLHTLKIDNRSIGELTGDNYYRVELWPGSYSFTVHLPEETFLGQTSRALSVSKRILLKPSDSGHAFFLQYTDGMKSGSFVFSPLNPGAMEIQGRTLAGSVDLRDTAKVLELFDARYDGPSRQDKAHGWGTLSWPDGCIYQGRFEYGEPTFQGRFIFPRGEYFRGLFREGRPYRSGLLFNQDGGIVYSGRFIDEKPHGDGIRLGSDGPEFCRYDHGQDITQPIEQQAREALDRLEAEQVEALLAPVKWAENQLSQRKEELANLQKHCLKAVEGPEPQFRRLKTLGAKVAELEDIRNVLLQQARHEQQALLSDFPRSRYARELGMRKQVTSQLKQAIARERNWCQSEFEKDRHWCQCAPFAEDYLDWTECRPQ